MIISNKTINESSILYWLYQSFFRGVLDQNPHPTFYASQPMARLAFHQLSVRLNYSLRSKQLNYDPQAEARANVRYSYIRSFYLANSNVAISSLYFHANHINVATFMLYFEANLSNLKKASARPQSPQSSHLLKLFFVFWVFFLGLVFLLFFWGCCFFWVFFCFVVLGGDSQITSIFKKLSFFNWDLRCNFFDQFA